jgi:hypothetical protein
MSSLAVNATAAALLLVTVVVYYRQLRTMQRQLGESRNAAVGQNILNLASFLQTQDVRSARDLTRNDLRSKDWHQWSDSERRAASMVCATYDLAAVVMRFGLVPPEPFIRNWGPSIRDCYGILRPFIKEMQKLENSGPEYWDDFDWLYEQAVGDKRQLNATA